LTYHGVLDSSNDAGSEDELLEGLGKVDDVDTWKWKKELKRHVNNHKNKVNHSSSFKKLLKQMQINHPTNQAQKKTDKITIPSALRPQM